MIICHQYKFIFLKTDRGGLASRRHYAPWAMYNARDWYNRIVHCQHKKLYYNHIPVWKLKKRLNPESWNNCYEFCAERNPWGRVILQYHWRYRDLPKAKAAFHGDRCDYREALTPAQCERVAMSFRKEIELMSHKD